MTTTAYFSIHNPNDPIAYLQHQHQRFEYLTWATAFPTTAFDSHRDATEYAATLTRSTGHTTRHIIDNLSALTTLRKLPRLHAAINQHFHVDMQRLRTIDNHTTGIHADLQQDHDFWDTLDQRLTELFTPTTPNQLVPGTARIRTIIKELVTAFTPKDPEQEDEPDDTDEQDPDQDTDQPEEEPPLPRDYHAWDNPDGTVNLELRVDQTTATIIHDAVRTLAVGRGISRGQALLELILANIAVTVTLNLYKAEDLPDNPGFLQPFGPLDPTDTDRLAELATTIRDADKAGTAQVAGYHPNDEVRAAVHGRDRICRWPGCTVPANQCQLDHRVNYTDGGPTTTTELLSLCPHHHNRKTDRQASYLLDPVTGDVYWLFQDGTWAVDLADGPLAPRQKRWNQNLAQKIARRQQRARQRAQDNAIRKQRQRPAPDSVPEEEPPF